MPACSALYNHECVNITGTRSPCCRFSDNSNLYTVENSSIAEYHQSDFIKNIRTSLETGWHPGCIKCKNEELSGLTSLRELYNLDHSFTANSIESIEISLSNECNLACRMCSPTYSTKWLSIIKNNPQLTKFVETPNIKNNLDNIINDRDLSSLRMIKYLGGEPFITPQVEQLFKLLQDKEILNNIVFHCSTNATLYPKKYIKYLKQFKKIRMHISLDGIDEINDYIRYGKKWKEILKVIELWKQYQEEFDNLELSIFSTIQAYNIHDIKNLETFSNSYNLKFRGSLLSSPSFLSINALPESYIEKIKDKYNEKYLKNYKNNKQDTYKLIEYTKTFDNTSNMYLRDIIPKLSEELLNEKL